MDEIRTEKRSVRGACFFITILAILYPLSIAPVQYLMYYGWLPGHIWRYQTTYIPLAWVTDLAPDSIGKLLESYAGMFLPENVLLMPYRTHGGVI